MAAPFNPIQAAFDTAIRDFKASLRDDTIYEQILLTRSIDQVYDATDKLQAEQSKKGHLRHLAKIGPYLTRLSEYSDALGIFVQVKPDVLALLWGPIVLLLQWASVLKTSFDAIVNTTADIGLVLPEFQQATRLFGQNRQIKDVLLLFFRDILDFYSVAFGFFRLPRWRYVFEALWPRHRDKIKVVTTHIERHTLLMRKEVQLEHIQQEHDFRLNSLAHFESTEKANRLQEYRGIKTDISPKTYDDRLNWLQGRICQGTGKWLLRDVIFAKWLDVSEKSTRLFWLQGIPGAGKTFLSSVVVDKARTLARTLFTFLSYTQSSNISALSILHSLIFQLASDDENLQTALCELSRETLKSNNEVALKILSTLLTCAGTAYIVIDGLDEVDEIERSLLVRQLLTILETCEGVKIFISSRPEADLKTLLTGHTTSIRVDDRNAGSIQAFVNQWTKNWFREGQVSPTGQAEIERWLAPLAYKSKGMFLYAKIVLSGIEFLDDFTEIENQLSVLPETLDIAYARILSRVNSLPPPSRDKARKLLGWIACTPAPLTIQEIQRVLAIKLNDREGRARSLADLQIEKICGPIVEVNDGYIQFVHFTVKEYISSPQIVGHIDTGESVLSLTMSCVSYLCQQHHEPELSAEEIAENVLAGAYILHGFAAATWPELVELSTRFFPGGTLPPELIHLLETLLFDRTNRNYSDDAEDTMQLGIEALKDDWPELHDMVLKSVRFRDACLTSQDKIQEGLTWTSLDPLTISQTSVLIHEATESLLGCRTQVHDNNCSCDQLQTHYGNQLFKCSFVHCPFHRQGFETRAARNSHEKYHDRPWKCNVPTCEYADGGFLSRKMRNDHLDQYHQAQKPQQDLNMLQLDPDEVQPLIFDLVQADKVDAVEALLSVFEDLPSGVKRELYKIAAGSGSPALLNLILPPKYTIQWCGFAIAAAKNKNAENLDHILQKYDSAVKDLFQGWSTFPNLSSILLSSNSKEIYEVWEKNIDSRILCWSGYISDMNSHPYMEQFVIRLWKKRGFIESVNAVYLGVTLARIAQSCCSVRLAKYLVEAGANVDHRRSDKYMTPLHHAARRSNAEAAELMRFLLECGADPEVTSGNLERKISRIRDEKGAKETSRWLGLSWDELVAQTKAGREKSESEKLPGDDKLP